MVRIIIANAFALSMLPLNTSQTAVVIIRRLSADEFKNEIMKHANSNHSNIVCAIGHESTAKLVSEILGISLDCRRMQIQLGQSDILFAVTLSFRPPEGKVYNYDEILKLAGEGKISFYTINIFSMSK